jgi:hypothetical protein
MAQQLPGLQMWMLPRRALRSFFNRSSRCLALSAAASSAALAFSSASFFSRASLSSVFVSRIGPIGFGVEEEGGESPMAAMCSAVRRWASSWMKARRSSWVMFLTLGVRDLPGKGGVGAGLEAALTCATGGSGRGGRGGRDAAAGDRGRSGP